MKKLGIISILAATLVAGCGSSTDHSSEWTKSQVASVESEFDGSQGASNLTGAQRACYFKGVEADFSPASVRGQASSGEKGQLKKILAECGLQVDSSSADTASTSGTTYGPACQKPLESAACVEEQEKTVGEAERQGEIKRSEEEKEENKEAEEEKARVENPSGQ